MERVFVEEEIVPYKDAKKAREYALNYRKSHKKEKREYDKRYRIKNIVKITKYFKKYCRLHKNIIQESKKNYNNLHKDSIREYKRKWRILNKNKIKKRWKKNKEKINKRRRKYNKSKHGNLIIRISEQKRREAKHNTIHIYTKEQWQNKLKKSKGICLKKYGGCGKRKRLTLDHIYPLFKANEDYNRTGIKRVYTIDDVVPLCGSCNSSWRDKIKK